MSSGPISLVSLYSQVQVLSERLDNLTHSLDEKHNQNRRDLHTMRNDIQIVSHQIWLIKIKLAGYAAGGGLLGAGGVTAFFKLLNHFSK